MSPTSLNMFENEPDHFFLTYVKKLKRLEQTKPMSVGSAFDAYVKSYIHNVYHPSETLFTEYFEKGVEEQNRDYARKAGKDVFDNYRSSGYLTKLINLFNVEEPQMEISVNFDLDGVPIFGKPDLIFYHKLNKDLKIEIDKTNILEEADKTWCTQLFIYEQSIPNKYKDDNSIVKITIDWKVNGYESQAGPKKGYVSCKGVPHKDVYPFVIDTNTSINEIVGIDQIFKRGTGKIDVAQHRLSLTPNFKNNVTNRFKVAWSMIQNGHYLSNLSFEESVKRCQLLENRTDHNKIDYTKPLKMTNEYNPFSPRQEQ